MSDSVTGSDDLTEAGQYLYEYGTGPNGFRAQIVAIQREAVEPWRVMVSRLASYLRAGERLNEQDEADIRALLEGTAR